MTIISALAFPKKKERGFLPENFLFSTWQDIEPYIAQLENRSIESLSDLHHWLRDKNELETVLSEDMRWKMIHMTCDTTNKAVETAYIKFIRDVQPHLVKAHQSLDEKLLQTPFLEEIDKEKYFIYLRSVQKSVHLFREENIPLFTQMRLKEKKYSAITGSMSIEFDGQEMTMQQASKLLQNSDRAIRKKAYFALNERRLQDRDKLDNLFNDLVKVRHQVAQNTGYTNYRDYKFDSMGRFDYTPEDCFEFHESIATQIVPLIRQIDKKHKKALGYDSLRPWDRAVDISGKPPLKPFSDTTDLVSKTVNCMTLLHPQFGQCLQLMDKMGHLDLDSRKGKAPGGYNCPLPEIGVPFIFMNAVGSVRDLTTMVHEGGHAVHSFLTRDLDLLAFKSTPSEVAELASMSMELFTMEHWHEVYFENEEEMRRAKRNQLEKVISGFSWMAIVDKFQHWIYTHPHHTTKEREQTWLAIVNEFSAQVTDWSGLETFQAFSWQKQLHIFEVPFYYIEYAMAQLGAIAMWKQYKENPDQALDNYIKALKLGYTKPIKEIYATAGIKFDFSKEYVRELGEFVMGELEGLYD